MSAVAIVFDQALFRFRDDIDWKDRVGGHFCLADGETGLPLLVVLVGSLLPDRGKIFAEFCQEKAWRLGQHPEHVSSWQSRNGQERQFGGAVRVGPLIFSFSGAPELGDEAMMLVTAHTFYQRDPKLLVTLNAISAVSNNRFFEPLLQQLSQET